MSTEKSAKDIMTKRVFSVQPDNTLGHVDALSVIRHVRHFPVVDKDGVPIGMISIRDLLDQLSAQAGHCAVPVSAVIKREPIVSSPDTPVSELAKLMRENDISCLPIVEDGQIVGVVSERDFLKLIDF